jgi:hypothetical protein
MGTSSVPWWILAVIDNTSYPTRTDSTSLCPTIAGIEHPGYTTWATTTRAQTR